MHNSTNSMLFFFWRRIVTLVVALFISTRNLVIFRSALVTSLKIFLRALSLTFCSYQTHRTQTVKLKREDHNQLHQSASILTSVQTNGHNAL